MKYLAFALALVVAAHATEFTGTATLAPGYSATDDVSITVTGNVTLSAPGNYTARSWDIAGAIQLASEGDYTLTATTGTIGLTVVSRVRGPATGTATLRLATTRAIQVGGNVATNVTILQGIGNVTPAAPPLVNLAVRATLAAGQTITPAFVVGGSVQRRVLIRAIGPTLAAFGVTNALATPGFTVFTGAPTVSQSNAAWGGGATLAAVFTSVGAFALPATSRDVASLLTLSPGAYTVQVGGGAGEVLCEVYFVE